MRQPRIDICLSPVMFDLHRRPGQTVVVIDVIRASTSVITALHHGTEAVLPVATIEEALEYKAFGYLTSGERNSFKLDQFDMGNSPFEFTSSDLKGKKIVMTTTNGTAAIRIASAAEEVLIGSFVNLDALTRYLQNSQNHILLLCAGWTNRVNIEDSLFAGRLASRLLKTGSFSHSSDSVSICLDLSRQAGNALFDYVTDHSPRLKSKLSWLTDDIRFCLSDNQMDTIPMLAGKHLIRLEQKDPL